VYLRHVSEPADRARTRLQHPGRQTSARSQLRRGRLNRRAIVGERGAHTSRRPHNRRPRTDHAASIKSRRVRRVGRRHPVVVDRAVKAVAGTLESVVQKPLGCRYGHRPRGTLESKYLEIEAVLKGRTFACVNAQASTHITDFLRPLTRRTSPLESAGAAGGDETDHESTTRCQSTHRRHELMRSWRACTNIPHGESWHDVQHNSHIDMTLT
jgi:hypothetical protein